MELFSSKTDLEFPNVIKIGDEVPANYQIRIEINLDVQASLIKEHEFSYQLCHGDKVKEIIGQPIILKFKLTD